MKTFNIYTLGCKVNQYESEAMEKIFIQNGYDKVDRDQAADTYIINTCTVTAAADSKSRQYISKARKLNPQATIAVVGCYSQVSAEEVEALEGVDIVVGTKHRHKILDLVEDYEKNQQKINVVENIKKNQDFDEMETNEDRNMTRAYIKIQEGCNMFCSYCIIPYARGPISSRDYGHIIDEAKRLALAGYKELILTGIHVESYGKDKGKDYQRLIDVIEGVAAIDGIERIRLSSVEPNTITDDFLARLKATKKACDHFHLSLQSGSDDVLKAMNRRYDSKEYAEKIDLIRSYFPDAGITTDLICGFPGESEKNHQETMDFIRTINFSKIHIFPYSRREGTPAATFKNQVPNKIKKKRARELNDLEGKIAGDFLDGYIGKTLDVLFEIHTSNSKYSSGYSTNYLRIKVPHDESLKNTIKRVKIDKRIEDQLYGEIID